MDTLFVDPEEYYDLSIATLEMRSQAPYKEAFAERFRQNDEYTRYLLSTVIERGIKAGVFTEVDADETDALRTAQEYVDAILFETE